MFSRLLAIAEEGAAEGSSSLEVLPDTDELLWGGIFFLILVVVMVKLVGPRVGKALEARTAKIQGQLEEADRTKREADQMMEQYRAQLADARAEAQRIIDEGKRTADSLRQEIVQKAEREAQEILSRARADVSGERDRAMQELRSTLSDLSIQLASRVIEKDLSSVEAHRVLVDRAIAELAASGNGNRG